MQIIVVEDDGSAVEVHPLVESMVRILVNRQAEITGQSPATLEFHYMLENRRDGTRSGHHKVSAKLMHHIGLERTSGR